MKHNTIIKSSWLAAIALLLLPTSFTQAQTELSLKEAVKYALEHKAEAIKAQLDIENARYKVEEVRANVLPQLNGVGGLTYNPKLQQMALDIGGQTQVLKMGTSWQSNAVVQLDQQLFNLAVFQGLKAAKTTKEFYQINAQLTEEQIIEKVANSYYEVFKTQSQLNTLESTMSNTARVRDVIASLEANGLAKKIDLDRIVVAYNNLNSSKIQLTNALKLQENALKYLIGMEIQQEISLPKSTFETTTSLLTKEEIDIYDRTEIQLLQKQGDLLKLNKASVQANRFPSLGLSANYGYLSMGSRFPYFAGAEKGVYGSGFSAVSLNLQIPLFAGFSNRAKVKQAEIEIQKFEADFEDAKLALNLAIENAFTQIKNAAIQLHSQESNKELALQVLQNVENNYKNGLANLTDLLDAENAYADAQNNYNSAVLDYKLAEIQLIKAKGRLKNHFSIH